MSNTYLGVISMKPDELVYFCNPFKSDFCSLNSDTRRAITLQKPVLWPLRINREEAGIRFREFPRSLACRNQCFEFLRFSGNDVFDRTTEARSPGSDYGSCRPHKAKGSFLPLQNRTRNSLDPVPCEMRREGLVQNTSTGSKSVASEIRWLSICCYNGLWSAWLMCRLSFLYPFCQIPAFFVLFRPCSRKW